MHSPLTLLVVENLFVSQYFYTEVLGLELLEQHTDRIKLKSGGHEIIMFEGTKKASNYDHGYNANSTLLITADNLDKCIEKLKSHNIEFIHKTPNKNRWGRHTALKDPSGIVHELFELNA